VLFGSWKIWDLRVLRHAPVGPFVDYSFTCL
jgi:hypothetical protein